MAFWACGHRCSVTWREASLKQSSRMCNTVNFCHLQTLWIIHLYTATSVSSSITPAALLVIEVIRNIDEYQSRTTIILKFIYRRIFAYCSCKSALNMHLCGTDTFWSRVGPLQLNLCVCVCAVGFRSCEEWHRRFYMWSSELVLEDK